MSKLYSALLFLRAIGFQKSISILKNTLHKNLADRQVISDKLSQPIQIGRVLNYSATQQGIDINFQNAKLSAQLLSPSTVRITWQPGCLIPFASNLFDLNKVVFQFNHLEHGWELKTNMLCIIIKDNGEINYYDQDHHLLRTDLPPWYQFESQTLESVNTVHWTSLATQEAYQAFLGMGEHSGKLDLLRRTLKIWNRDPGGAYGADDDPLYMPLPVYLSLQSKGAYLICYQNSSKAIASFPQRDTCEPITFQFSGGALCYLFIIGSLDKIYQELGSIIGKPALPPQWSFGYHQSRWGYKSEEKIRQIIRGFETHEIPISAIHLDIDYMDGYRVFTINNQRFPDLEALAAELHSKGIRLVTIIDPGIKKDKNYHLFRNSTQQGLLVKLKDIPYVGSVWPGDAVFPDFINSHARHWWGKQYLTFQAQGVDGFWHDMNEPSSFVVFGDGTLPLKATHNFDGQNFDHRIVHNLYGFLMNRAAFEGMSRDNPGRRPWIVSRSGWIGNSQYAWNWTADIETTWSGLRQTVQMIISLSLSGIPFTGSDIGGFTGNPDAELYIRWLQMACFCAFMRTHSAIETENREPWVFGEPFTGIIRQYIQLRYQLLPYIYTIAWHVNQSGIPLVRPILWTDPQQVDLWQIEDEFLLGSRILVAPVIEKGSKSRLVKFPDGNWFDYWTDIFYSGNQTVEIPAPLEIIPLFIRANSLVPMIENGMLILHVYLNLSEITQKPCLIGDLYSDEGDGYGGNRLDWFELSKQEELVTLRWQSQGDFYFPFLNITIKVHGNHPNSWIIDGKQFTEASNQIEVEKFTELSWIILAE